MKKIETDDMQISTEELGKLERKRLKRSKRRTTGRALDRIFGFLLVTVILLGVGGLILTVAFVMLSAAAFRGFFAALAFFPKFMSRVLWNRKDKV